MFIKAVPIGATLRPRKAGGEDIPSALRGRTARQARRRGHGKLRRGDRADGRTTTPTTVFNQSPPYAGRRSVRAAIGRCARRWRRTGRAPRRRRCRRSAGAGARRRCSSRRRLANENPPKLRTFDAKGRRIDVVEFHPAYHPFMAESIAAGLHASTWRRRCDAARRRRPRSRARRATYMVAQVENGHMCPITMTRASVAALGGEPALLRNADAEDRVAPLRRRVPPVAREVRHHARHGHDREAGRHRRARQHHDARCRPATATGITGHKWFMSAPMCDAFLVLAQAPDGLTCFFLPRFRPDGSVNALQLPAAQGQARQPLQRLLRGRIRTTPIALRVGEEGRGVRTIIADGAADAARLRHRLGRPDAHGAGAGGPPRPPPQRVRQAARRAADDARGAGRHGARGGGARSPP